MNKLNSNVVSVAALVLSAAAIVMCTFCCGGKKDPSVEEVLAQKPEIIINAMKAYEQKMVEEQQAKARKALQDSMAEIIDASAGVIANPEGKFVLVKFYDFSCGYCKQISPALTAIAEKNPNVKIIGRELTFLGPISQYAAKAVLAAKEQGKYTELYHALMDNKTRLTETKIDEIAVLSGLDLEKLKADMNSEIVASQLEKTNELAAKIQVRGVPTLVFNGKVLQTLNEAEIQKAIDSAK